MLQTRAVKWITWSVALVSSGAWSAELNALKDLQVKSTGAGAQVIVSGSRAPTFTVFRLSDPDRLVVDLSGADASGIKGHHDGTGPVAGVVASQFSDERASVGRVLVALDHASQYDVRADGTKVVIAVDALAGQPASSKPLATALAAAEPAKAPVANTVSPVAPTSAQASAAVAKAEPKPAVDTHAAKAEAPHEENVVAATADERPVTHPASHITAMKLAHDSLQVSTDGEIAKYELLELSDPPRLALDVYGVGLKARAPKAHSKYLKDLRAGAHSDKVRVVLDVDGDMPRYHIERTAQGLALKLGGAPPALAKNGSKAEPVAEAEIDGEKVSLETEPVAHVKAADPEPASKPVLKNEAKPVEVADIGFVDAPSGGKIDVKLSAGTPYKVEKLDERSVALVLDHAHLPKRLERSLDTSALDTPVKMVSAFAVPNDRVRVVVAASGPLEQTVMQTSAGLSWRLSVKGVKTEEVAVSPKAAAFTTEAQTYAATGAPRAPQYTGKRVTFEFKDIDIHNLLRVIAEVSKKNVVVADDVSGKVTIRLRNVPWDQAFELILRSKGLGKEEIGNIVRVAPLKTLEEEAKLREARKKSLMNQEELTVQLIPVNYATAGTMADRVKDVLTERGSVTVDARTNVMIVRDIRGSIDRAKSLVQHLDTPTPQVLIESRIVEANTTYTRQLGVQWGGQATAAPGTGNPTGLVFPSTVGVTGGSTQDVSQGVSGTPNWAVNLPVGVGTGSGGALGFVFGSAGGALQLNLRLSALENQGSIKTISSPKVTTLDNNTAKISQGVSIPFSQVSAQGVSTSFVEARLSLEVTPHITQDGSVLMAIKAENNQPDPANTGANGQPAIQRKEATTQVLVKDGDTTVIGGIYVRRGSNSSDSVPFFSKIPILGFFFRDERESDSRQELLIFITPRIINRQTIASNL